MPGPPTLVKSLGDRCQYIRGDMFKEVPPADAYIMKMILHDWNDEDGGEKTVEEYSSLLERSGWKYSHIFYPQSNTIGIVEGVKK